MSMKVFVGLGNPEDKYKNTRHNIGFIFIDRLAGRLNIRMKYSKFYSSYIGENDKYVLVKPQTYMNSSGISVKKVLKNKKLEPNDVYIIHDDIHLPLGKSRLKLPGSGSGGHNGIKSIIKETGGKLTRRIKIGISGNRNGQDLKDYVLDRFTPEEMDKIIPILDDYINKILKGELDV